MSAETDPHQLSTDDLIDITPNEPQQNQLFHATIPKVDWHDEKRQAIKQLTEDLLEATQIPTVEQTVKNLELLKLPTRKLFYDYGSLLDKKFLSQLYPEFMSIRPGKPIPDEIGSYRLDPHYQFLNERYYIIPILERVGDEGYDIAKVTNQGIYFLIKEEDIPESIQADYRRFFMTQDQVLYQIEQVIQGLLKNNPQRAKSFTDIYRLRINGEQFNHIRITYPDLLTRHEINQMRLELSAHYKKMGYQIKFFYDRNLEDQTFSGAVHPEPTVLKIFFNLQEIVPQIRDRMNSRKVTHMPSKNTKPIQVVPETQTFVNPNGLSSKSKIIAPPKQPNHELDLDSSDFLLD